MEVIDVRAGELAVARRHQGQMLAALGLAKGKTCWVV
jgi:hypothetical protein